MASAAQVLKAALQEILVQDSEAPLQAAEYQDAVFAMNNYMFALDANGLSLGYTEVTGIGDTITVPPGAIQGMVANIAIMLAPQFGRPITQELALKARTGMQAMINLGVDTPILSLPDTLPIGSGNEDPESAWNDYRFYPDANADNALTEAGENIGLESST